MERRLRPLPRRRRVDCTALELDLLGGRPRLHRPRLGHRREDPQFLEEIRTFPGRALPPLTDRSAWAQSISDRPT
ncbi:MAG: hypothetical protein E7L06_00345 [Schaalia turicensis]|nr:hypothetical protein [Schaalia turicensis]